MTDRADICIPRILKHEGGYVNHPNDPGGPTNKGITIATYRRYINQHGTIDDIKRLTTAEAVEVYRHQYWNKVKADELPVGVDYAVSDFAVNSGPSRAARYLQACVGVAQDGQIGPKTIAAVAGVSPERLVDDICDRRMAFLRALSTWSKFGKGWTRRVSEVRADSLADARSTHTTPTPPDVEPIAPAHPDPAEQPQGFLAAILALLRAMVGAK